MNVMINDCTIRDGGYLLDKNPDQEYVRGVFSALVNAGVDVIEIGFLQNKNRGESVVYGDSIDAGRYSKELSSSRFTGFCDNSRYSIGNLDKHNEDSAFDYLKISFAKHEWHEALEFVDSAKRKGYKVFANPMDAPSYSFEERKEMIGEINSIKPFCFSIVDTFGSMYLRDLVSVFEQVDSELDQDIRIGLHSHNNLGLSNALAETMIDLAAEVNRDIVVDASLYGMGRGAGNAATEVIASYLNENYGSSYGLGFLFDAIDEYVAPLKAKTLWGYDLPMLTCGLLGAHVDNVFHLRQAADLTSAMQFDIISRLEQNQRKRYGKNYSKSDFSILDAAAAEVAREG